MLDTSRETSRSPGKSASRQRARDPSVAKTFRIFHSETFFRVVAEKGPIASEVQYFMKALDGLVVSLACLTSYQPEFES